MAEGRQRVEWQRAAVVAAAAVAAMGGGFKPEQFMPRALRQPTVRPRALTPEEAEAEAARTWRMIDRAFTSGKAVRRR